MPRSWKTWNDKEYVCSISKLPKLFLVSEVGCPHGTCLCLHRGIKSSNTVCMMSVPGKPGIIGKTFMKPVQINFGNY